SHTPDQSPPRSHCGSQQNIHTSALRHKDPPSGNCRTCTQRSSYSPNSLHPSPMEIKDWEYPPSTPLRHHPRGKKCSTPTPATDSAPGSLHSAPRPNTESC